MYVPRASLARLARRAVHRPRTSGRRTLTAPKAVATACVARLLLKSQAWQVKLKGQRSLPGSCTCDAGWSGASCEAVLGTASMSVDSDR